MQSNHDDISARTTANIGRDMKSKIGVRFRQQVKQDMGGPDSMRHQILGRVAEERYDEAIKDIDTYRESCTEYPRFKQRADRYLDYAADLVNGIRAKRSFPGINMLATAKQQELYERAVEHFEDLRATLRKVDHIEKEVKLEDIRSTVWVVKAFIYSVIVLMIVGFTVEVSRGVLPAFGVVLESESSNATNWVFDKLGI